MGYCWQMCSGLYVGFIILFGRFLTLKNYILVLSFWFLLMQHLLLLFFYFWRRCFSKWTTNHSSLLSRIFCCCCLLWPTSQLRFQLSRYYSLSQMRLVWMHHQNFYAFNTNHPPLSRIFFLCCCFSLNSVSDTEAAAQAFPQFTENLSQVSHVSCWVETWVRNVCQRATVYEKKWTWRLFQRARINCQKILIAFDWSLRNFAQIDLDIWKVFLAEWRF